MKWTNAQEKVIFSHGKTVIVAAGAGAGKTSCLTERILEGIDKGTDIAEMLVVTFTKAAASDIRQKLYEKLTARIAQRPDERRLFTQLSMLPVADISTVDAFCLRIVKQNFQLLGLSPALRVLGSAESKALKVKCADAMMSECYETGIEGFTDFVDAFADPRSDGKIAETIIKLYDKISSYPDPFGYLDECVKRTEADVNLPLSDSPTGKALVGALRLLADRYLAESEAAEKEAIGSDGTACEVFGYHAALAQAIKDTLFLSSGAVNALAELLATANVPTLKTSMCAEEEKALFKSRNNSLKNRLSAITLLASCDEETFHAQSKRSLSLLRVLCSMMKMYDGLYTKAKTEKNACDYSDIEHMTLRLLNDNGLPSPLCLRLREQIKQLYIDEYQDINPLQDTLFTLLSDGKNRFMVGDVKQSIYRFRHADPDIFTSYVSDFPPYTEGEGDTGKLYLSENFRSGRPIIDFVNSVFDATTPDTYTEDERLVCALGEGGGGETPILALYEDAENEAAAVAREIQRRVGSYIKRDGTPLCYGDCALLMTSPAKDGGAFMREMKKLGIPYVCERNADFLDAPEVLLMTSLLRCIDNPLDDISLASALRSEVFGFDADDLLAIRRQFGGDSLYASLCSATTRTTGKRYTFVKTAVTAHRMRRPRRIRRGTGELAEKVTNAVAKLKYYRSLAPKMPVHELIWHIFTTTLLLGSEASPERRNLLTLYSQARTFEGGSYRGLSPFVEFYRDVYDGKDDADSALAPSRGGDCVRIMTIHKSKGLDFPAVFLARCSKQANRMDAYEKILSSRTGGIAFTYRDADTHETNETLAHAVAAVYENFATDGERLRLLYVALTRAKELLFLSGSAKYASDSFAAVFMNAAPPSDILELRIDESVGDEISVAVEQTQEKTLPRTVSESYALEAIAFTYPYEGTPRAKISVSELEDLTFAGGMTSVSRSVVRTKPSFVTQTVSGAQRGTAMHEFMQFASYENVARFGVRYEAQSLVAKRMLTTAQLALLDFKRLEDFFSSPLYAEIAASTRVEREKRFSIIENGSLFGKDSDSEVLVQGVIDLFYLTPDGYTVVDYKTDASRYTDRETILRSHETQLRYYCRAVTEMTGVPVTRAVIYAFSLSEALELPL